ncbi:MAG TPA: hypothetical protein VF074_23610, partial [Pyrinomonadaceae bacterium]
AYNWWFMHEFYCFPQTSPGKSKFYVCSIHHHVTDYVTPDRKFITNLSKLSDASFKLKGRNHR